MEDLQRVGGIAALTVAATYVVGFALLLLVLVPAGHRDGDAEQTVAFLADNRTVMHVWNATIYLLSGVVLVALVLALHERLGAAPPAIVRAATAFGLIWAGLLVAAGMVANTGLGTVVDLHGEDPARAASVWSGLHAVQEGLGGGSELVGGLWILLLSAAARRTGALPRALNGLGVVIGAAGILTVAPALDVLTAAFGLGFIVWYVWVGLVLLGRDRRAASARRGAPGAARLA